MFFECCLCIPAFVSVLSQFSERSKFTPEWMPWSFHCSELIFLWCSGSFSLISLLDFSCESVNHLNIDLVIVCSSLYRNMLVPQQGKFKGKRLNGGAGRRVWLAVNWLLYLKLKSSPSSQAWLPEASNFLSFTFPKHSDWCVRLDHCATGKVKMFSDHVKYL